MTAATARAAVPGGGNADLIPAELFTAAARGLRLHPLQPYSKLPCLEDWPRLASCDPQQFELWLREYPICNWGLVCGPDSGIWVLDCDGESGADAVVELCRKHGGDWLSTLTCTTGRGSHLYYRWPDGHTIRNSVGKVAQGINVHGDGDCLLIPPSVYPSGNIYQYQWVDAAALIAEAPSWLLDMVTSRCGELRLIRGTEIAEQEQPAILADHLYDATSTGIHGRPGDGKTTAALLIAANLSCGRTPHSETVCRPRNVLVMSNGDSPSRIRKLFSLA